MRHTCPDTTTSTSTLGNNNLGDSDKNKFRDQKKQEFVKKTVSFGGTTNFEGRIEVLKAAVYNFIHTPAFQYNRAKLYHDTK